MYFVHYGTISNTGKLHHDIRPMEPRHKKYLRYEFYYRDCLSGAELHKKKSPIQF